MALDLSKSEYLEKYVRTRIRFGNNEEEICIAVTAMNPNLEVGYVKNTVSTVCKNYPNYDLIHKIMRSRIVRNIRDHNELYIVDFKNMNTQSISDSCLKGLFDSKMKLDHKEFMSEFIFDPYSNKVIWRSEDGTSWFFNLYIPPFWYKETYFSNGKVEIPRVDNIPEMYEKFLIHLVDGDMRSYNYIVDWIANGLRGRNYCILTTIGNQGIGKGVLGNIMRQLFGEPNFYHGTDKAFKKDFNSHIGEKRLVYVDEFSIKQKEHEDKLKLVVNDFIEVEKKYKDAKEVKNYSNFYMSSNNLDSIKLTADDRRFSIVNLTEKRLIDLMKEEDIKLLTDASNIQQLAYYLYHKKLDHNMSKVFISERTAVIREAGLSEWQDWFLNEFCVENAGKEFTQSEVSDKIEDKYGTKIRPGRPALMNLHSMYPSKFNLVNRCVDGKRLWKVVIQKENV